jgi:hypothetical protein
MGRLERFIRAAIKIASKSKMEFRHGAVLVKGKCEDHRKLFTCRPVNFIMLLTINIRTTYYYYIMFY